jgi:hypothetical protein
MGLPHACNASPPVLTSVARDLAQARRENVTFKREFDELRHT